MINKRFLENVEIILTTFMIMYHPFSQPVVLVIRLKMWNVTGFGQTGLNGGSVRLTVVLVKPQELEHVTLPRTPIVIHQLS